LVDDFSRFIPGYALWDEDRAEAVVEAFESAVARHGKPESVMSDRGAAFWAWRGVSRFTRLLEEMEVDQLVAAIPQHNGKLEVLNANAQKELFNQERFFDLGEAAARLRAWVTFYNLRRTHHALGGLLVPADRYFGRSDEVLAQIEAGGVPDGIGEPVSLAERMLDVMRVSSRGGKLELWMMGQRVWPQASTP
jgi:transposase InsO family protein